MSDPSYTQYLAACLVLASIQTIGTSSATIGGYNMPPYTPYNSTYYMQVVFLILACLGVIIGLYAIMKPDYFEDNRYVLLGLTVVWLGVTVWSTELSKTVVTNPTQMTGYGISYGISAVILGLTGYSFYQISQ